MSPGKAATKFLIVLTVLLTFCIATPAAADTIGPSFGNMFPSDGQILPGGSYLVEITAVDPDTIDPRSFKVLINGNPVQASIDYKIISIDPIAETEEYDYTEAVINYRQFFTDNLYNVEVQVKDGAGNLSVKKWSFEVRSVPIFGNLAPSPSTTVDTQTPKISASISSVGSAIEPSSVKLQINGEQVPVIFDPLTGQVTYTPVNPLAWGTNVNVLLSAATLSGQYAYNQWSFLVDYPQMPFSAVKENCLKCHTNMPQQHKMTNCSACHDVALRKIYQNALYQPHFIADSCFRCHDTASHEQMATASEPAWLPIDKLYSCEQCHSHSGETLAAVHQSVATDTCQQCHSSGLTQEHFRPGRTDDDGSAVTCFTCHNSIKPTVQNAILNNSTSCESCHTAVTHAVVHNNPSFTFLSRDPDMDCSNCHNSSVSDEHITGKFTASKGYNCDTCHNSTRPEVQAAISNNNLNCEACHIDPATNQPKVHTSSGPPLHDSTFVLSAESDCIQCHANNLKTVHVGQPNKLDNNNLMTCATCHDSTNPVVQAAIVTDNTRCDACHTTRHASVDHTFPAGYVLSNPNNMDCASCHQGTGLTEVHVDKTSSSGVVMGCSTCHSTTAPDNVKTAVSGGQKNCDACHVIHQDSAQAHLNPAYTALQPDPDMNCSSCHNSSVSDEHITGKLNSGKGYTCGTCHNSTIPEVQAAIANNNLNCEACHATVHTSPNPYHATTFVTNKTMACEKCHEASSIASEHTKYKTLTGQAITCQTCHDSTDSKVQTAIITGNTGCDSCHTTRHTDVQTPHRQTYIPNTSYNCLNCHPATALSYNFTASFHRVSGVTPTTNLLHGGTFVYPWTATSNVECRGCHGQNPFNGLYYAKLLKGNYTSNTGKYGYSGTTELCFLCHDKAYYAESRTSAGSGFKLSNGINLHTNYAHAYEGCQACHSKNPHSASLPHFIGLNSTKNPASRVYYYEHSTYYDYFNGCGGCHSY